MENKESLEQIMKKFLGDDYSEGMSFDFMDLCTATMSNEEYMDFTNRYEVSDDKE